MAGLHRVDLKPLQTLFLQFTTAEFVLLLNYVITGCVIGRQEWSETPRSPRFELVCHQTLDINLKPDLWHYLQPDITDRNMQH